MNLAHWQKQYTSETQVTPSPFARWVDIRAKRVLDLGCGVGRDSYYLSQANEVTGIDQCAPIQGNMDPSYCQPHFVRADVLDYLDRVNPPAEVAYARFFFHACDEDTQASVFDWVRKHRATLYAEFRSDRDKPTRLDHSRRLINGVAFLHDLWDAGLKLTYYNEGYDLAPYQGENPHIIRVIAKG